MRRAACVGDDRRVPLRIEDYALIGDTQTAALVGRDGSIDWLCLPRFDSGACFASLVGDPSHGRWQIAPKGGVRRTSRRYRDDTLVLETTFETEDGTVRVVDCMPPRQHDPDVLRIVEGVEGSVPMRMELVVRFDYGAVVPWVRKLDDRLSLVAGPDALALRTPLGTRGEGLTTVSEFTVSRGDRVPAVLSWHASHRPAPRPIDPFHALVDTETWWTEWTRRCTYAGPYRDLVVRSLTVLKALTYAPTGGVVAAPTTSLPERLGGVRNWDYRYCWIRDATFTLYALMAAGYRQEARAWRDWLLRAVAGHPQQMQILYGAAGERRIPELELPWLGGYEGSKPVRVGNAAARQFQLDVFGEAMDCLHQARRIGIDTDPAAWDFQRALVEWLESAWERPDDGIWEVRGPQRHFTHSKVMAWVAFDRAIKAVERHGLDGPADRWRKLRDEVHREVCERGWDANRRTFTQFYGSSQLDASLLMIPLVGFLPVSDERVKGTIAAIERELCRDGFVLRYSDTGSASVDALPPGEGVFLPCTFWYADDLALLGRHDEARAVFERCASIANEVGLLSEEYDPTAKRLVGNFPQAFSHVALVNGALNQSGAHVEPARHREG